MSLPRTLIAAIVTLTLLAYGLTSYSTPEISPSVLWFVESNPSDRDDSAQASCVVGDYVAVAGSDFSPGNSQFRVEVRLKSNGSLVFHVVRDLSGDNEYLSDCVSVGRRVFTVGARPEAVPPKAFMAVLDVDSRDFNVKDLGWMGLSSAIVYDGSHVYVGGGDLDLSKLLLVFRVDKVDPSSLSRVAYYKSGGLSGHHSGVVSMAFNAKTGHLWLVGAARKDSTDRWWVEVVDKGSMSLVRSVDLNIPGWATGVASDSAGNVYIVGDKGVIVKLNSEGDLVKRVEISGASFYKIFVYEGSLLILGHEKVSGYYRHILYELDLDLNIISRHHLSHNVEADSYFTIGKASIENSILYVAGINKRPGNFQWTMYSIALKPQLLTVTVTTTITETKTETVRETMTATITKTETKTQTETKTSTITQTRTTTETTTQTITETKTIETTTTKTETTTQTIRETKTETVRETMTTTITKTEPKTETTIRTVTALETKIMTTTQKETVKTTETLEVTKEITKTETTTREIIPTTPLVAASIALIVLAISLVILLRGRK